MCQLLGLNANTPTDVMFSFTGFSTRAEEHKDGFGIAFFEGAGVRLMVDVEPDVTTATYEAGVLEVRLTLTTREPGARKIDIQTGEGEA